MKRVSEPGVVLLLGLVLGLVSVVPVTRADEGVSGGELRLHAGEGAPVQAPLLATAVSLDITGTIATVKLEQRFRNVTEHWVEARYAFPLPETAAVNRMRMSIGERVISGSIVEKVVAQRRYQEARAAGKKAALVQQHRPNLFRSKVANVAPGEEIVVALEYVQRVEREGDRFRLRFPLTMTPRYVPARVDVATLPDAVYTTASALVDSGSHRLSVTAALNTGQLLASVHSLYHPLTLSRSGYRYQLALAETETLLDEDLVLEWQPQLGAAPEGVLLVAEHEGEHYGLLTIVPPGVAAADGLARELVFVIDTSGSMGGSSIRQAKAALQFALEQLNPENTFNIIAFSDRPSQLFAQARAADRHNVARAREFVRQLQADGGTNMLPALELALPEEQGESVRQVVFITDGAVGNESELYSFIKQRLASSRLFTVGIGAAPNGWFMRKAADFGRGSFTFIGDESEVSGELGRLFTKLRSPQLTDIQVHWPGIVEMYPQRIPDLYVDQPVEVLVRFDQPPANEVIAVTGSGALGTWQRDVPITPVANAGAVATLWAQSKIQGLLDTRYEGASTDSVRAAVLPLALQYQLLSPYTSFVAIEEVISRPPGIGLAHSVVPNLLPSGHSAVVSWPATDLGIYSSLVTGTMCLLLAAVLQLLRRRFPCQSFRVGR